MFIAHSTVRLPAARRYHTEVSTPRQPDFETGFASKWAET
jgi:hypothetical protein